MLLKKWNHSTKSVLKRAGALALTLTLLVSGSAQAQAAEEAPWSPRPLQSAPSSTGTRLPGS